MKLDEMLREVFSECYKDGKNGYKTANKNFHDLLDDYNLNDSNHLKNFKISTNDNEYDFSEAHIQLLKFIKEIDNVNPYNRKNPSPEKLTLENFNTVADVVKKAINEEKYPAITNDLKSTLRTPEFLSLYSLHNLVKKITLLFQYVCQNNYSDFKIYNQVNDYLDMLLYTYAGHEHYSDFMNEVYCKPLGIKMPHGSDNKIEFDISIYRGVKKYVQNVFYAVTIGDGKSNSIETDLVQGEYRYVFEFDSIEEIADFIGEYLKYFNESCEFLHYVNQSAKYIRYTKVPSLCNYIMDEITRSWYIDETEKQKQINLAKEIIEYDINFVRKHIELLGEPQKKIKTLCMKLRASQKRFINKYMYIYGNGDLLRVNWFIGMIKKEVFDLIKNNINDLSLEIVETLFYNGFILPLYTPNLNKLMNSDDCKVAVEFQLSYKSYKIQLSNMAMVKKLNSNISNEDIIKCISEALKKTDNQITSDFENDNDLYFDISKAVGNYLFKIFEQSEANKSKKKKK